MCSLRKTETFKAAARVLEGHEVEFRVEKGSKHPRILFEVNGRPFLYVLSGSLGDRRAAMNVASDVRRMVRQALTGV